MGIQGLLQFLKEASEPVHIKNYKGQTVVVDTYCWLHKGAFACAEKLAKGEPTDQYVSYCMKLVHMLQSFDVKPILVFDGCSLPSKKEVEKARHERRQTNLQKGKQLLREGKLSEARECFSRSVNITSSMAHDVIKAARAEGIDCIVAPYEADAQLAYMNKNGFAQAVITEDSDLLAFGCKKVILKMDKYGNGLEIDQARFGMCKHLGDSFTEEKFRYMCILSGCDYLPSIHGIGLVKACKLLKIANNPDIITVIKKIATYLKMNITVPEGYIEGFIRANNTFLYQFVFDPVERKLVPLNPYEDVDPTELNYAGPNIGDSAALQIALGNKDLHTMKQIDNYNPDIPQAFKHRSQGWNKDQKSQKTSRADSIWNRNYVPGLNVVAEKKSVKKEEKNSRRGLITPCKTHAVKRHHEDEVSEVDLLTQYSFPKAKKTRPDCEDSVIHVKSTVKASGLNTLNNSATNKESNSQPKIRNTFSTVLQRRNETPRSISDTGTRSRFFCTPTDVANSSSKNKEEQLEEKITNDCDNQSEINQRTKIITPDCDQNNEKGAPESPIAGDCGLKTIEASPLQTKRSCFSWSGSLASGTPRTQSISQSLRKFQRVQPLPKPHFQNGSPLRLQPSCDSLCLLEKQNNLEREDSGSEEPDNDSESSSQTTLESSPVQQVTISERKGTKAPGLLKPKSTGSNLGTKVKQMVPAKASGLRSKGLKKATETNENKPGLQATINDLWKNFGFKKRCEPAAN
ncbi:exonuclease 1 [Discoglossus pictus]